MRPIGTQQKAPINDGILETVGSVIARKSQVPEARLTTTCIIQCAFFAICIKSLHQTQIARNLEVTYIISQT